MLNGASAWSHGLFISYTGFSPGGLDAFSRGKTSLICMNGYDLHETLVRGLALDRMISRKAHHAVETGQVCVSVRELFP